MSLFNVGPTLANILKSLKFSQMGLKSKEVKIMLKYWKGLVWQVFGLHKAPR